MKSERDENLENDFLLSQQGKIVEDEMLNCLIIIMKARNFNCDRSFIYVAFLKVGEIGIWEL